MWVFGACLSHGQGSGLHGRGWRDASAVESTWGFCRQPRYGWFAMAHDSSPRASNALFWLPGAPVPMCTYDFPHIIENKIHL